MASKQVTQLELTLSAAIAVLKEAMDAMDFGDHLDRDKAEAVIAAAERLVGG